MLTCKDCIHNNICKHYVKSLANSKNINFENSIEKFCEIAECDHCEDFQDRSKFVELPYSVKPGDKVYFILDGLGELDLKEYAFTVGDCAVCNTPDTIIDVSTKGFFYNGLHYRNEGELRPDDCDFVPWVELGKTAFLTREKAEQALKEKSDD